MGQLKSTQDVGACARLISEPFPATHPRLPSRSLSHDRSLPPGPRARAPSGSTVIPQSHSWASENCSAWETMAWGRDTGRHFTGKRSLGTERQCQL